MDRLGDGLFHYRRRFDDVVTNVSSTDMDFTTVIAIDTLEDCFEKRPFSGMQFSSTTPYTTTKFLSCIDQLAQLHSKASVIEDPPEVNTQGRAGVSATHIPDVDGADGAQEPTKGGRSDADGTTRDVDEPPLKNTESGDDVCGSLEDWLHPLPTFGELELPPHMRGIFKKHKNIHAIELKRALSSFGSLLEGIYRKQMGLMLSEASKVGFRSDEGKHECPDVTFDVPAALAPRMCDATASDSFPQQQNQLDCPRGTVVATLTISSPEQPK
ncbi:hypothetical protein ZWY2020_040756 [Hordeum vulgare]|nr:hypothetical protein ZWY2020_040756 [Hordeum vulgare]